MCLADAWMFSQFECGDARDVANASIQYQIFIMSLVSSELYGTRELH